MLTFWCYSKGPGGIESVIGEYKLGEEGSFGNNWAAYYDCWSANTFSLHEVVGATWNRELIKNTTTEYPLYLTGCGNYAHMQESPIVKVDRLEVLGGTTCQFYA
jgi:hypothetical protein